MSVTELQCLSLSLTPEQCPSVVSLLSESYNPHVRCGAAMALGICCAGTGNKVSTSSTSCTVHPFPTSLPSHSVNKLHILFSSPKSAQRLTCRHLMQLHGSKIKGL
ncbi:unnamed protein product [Oncorhynchus mykiss]|uniref:Uncharacterized protein n=1 Tax=Oncorhynchus mykiss TaxID=8022 RepID=A0A060XTT3_ONCMY|nr:unnamed protein product [Oncorhynchus mykiss]